MKKSGFLLLILVALGAIGLFVSPVLRNQGSAIPSSTVSAPTADAPAAEATAAPSFASGGLGQPLAWWEAQYGTGQEEFGIVRYGPYGVMDMGGEKAAYVELRFEPEVQLVEAEQAAAAVLPADAKLIERYSPEGRPEAVVDLYESAALAEQFVADVWTGGEPGQFIVLYKVFDDVVTAAIVATGNNP